MSEEKRAQRRKRIKFIFFKIPVVLMIISAVLLGALKLVERHPDPLRQGFEEYLSKASGRNATIGKLEKIKFFPNFIVSTRNITIHNGQNAAIIDLEIEELDINSPFSSMFINSKKINSFVLKNLTATENMLGPKEIKISLIEIVTKKGPDQFGSFLVADGEIGGEKTEFEMELEVGKYNYRMPSDIPFSLRMGQYEVNATLQRNFRSTTLENTVFSKGEASSEAQKYLFSNKKGANKDNPLTCLLNKKNLSDCDKYLSFNKKIEN